MNIQLSYRHKQFFTFFFILKQSLFYNRTFIRWIHCFNYQNFLLFRTFCLKYSFFFIHLFRSPSSHTFLNSPLIILYSSDLIVFFVFKFKKKKIYEKLFIQTMSNFNKHKTREKYQKIFIIQIVNFHSLELLFNRKDQNFQLNIM